MSKRSRKHGNYRKKNDNSVLLIVVVLVLIIGLGSVYALTANGNSGAGTNTGGTAASGQSVSSLESQVTALTAQVKSNPKDPTLHENLGTALFNLANSYQQSNDSRVNETFAKTIKVYNETIELEPGNKETLGDLATAYYYTNQVDQAIYTVKKALKIDPAFAPALMNYGIYLADGKRDYQNAIAQWQKVPASSPSYNQAQSFIQQYKQTNP